MNTKRHLTNLRPVNWKPFFAFENSMASDQIGLSGLIWDKGLTRLHPGSALEHCFEYLQADCFFSCTQTDTKSKVYKRL